MLSCKDLIETVKTSFASIKKNKKSHRLISLIDTLMSGYALFSLKYPSLLQFDRHHREDMMSHNLEHIFGIKEGDHKHLFEEFNALPRDAHEQKEGKITHRFSWLNKVAINDTHLDCEVNVLEYQEEHDKGKKQRWVWVTNIPLTAKNVYQIMRGARARHKI